ncbi:hypothetical protein LCGC14_1909960 [marine sediment metagenome]|uniref:Uncharacterized protein n=1 Tax=marine sediment metagenome TaxID=412755 RepID=A0A0F9I7W5_9ZZZZ
MANPTENPGSQGAREVWMGGRRRAAFGELLVAQPRPIVQLQYPYNINTRLVMTNLNGSGATTVANSLLTVTTGTTTSSTAMLMSRDAAKYHPGQGTLTRFTAIFTTGVADTTQEMGYGLVTDGFFFGYNGTAFGVLRREGGAREVQTLTISAGAGTASGDIRITLDSVTNDVTVANADSIGTVVRKIVAETDWNTIGNGWTVEANGDEVLFRAFDAAAKTGTFAIADVSTTTGVAGSFAETIAGAASTDTWVAQTAWNVDKMDGSGPSGMTLDQTKGNVYEIQFQWLGFGAISFFIEDPTSGNFQLVHQIQYANANTTPSVQNPTLHLHIRVDNGSTTSAIVIKTSSGAIFTEGIDDKLGIDFGASNTKALSDANETVILVIKNKTVYQSLENRVDILPLLLTLSAIGAGNAKFHIFRVRFNPILGGTPSFSDVDASNSVIATDTASTTVSGGSLLASFVLGKTASLGVDLTSLAKELQPGSLLAITAQIAGGTTDVDVALVWRELF